MHRYSDSWPVPTFDYLTTALYVIALHAFFGFFLQLFDSIPALWTMDYILDSSDIFPNSSDPGFAKSYERCSSCST